MTIMPMKPGAGTIEEILAMPALPGMQPPATPFVWGQGGAQLTPEQLAGQRDIASALAQADYSPVQNWAQGLGRVLDNFTGSQDLKRLDGQEAQMNEQRAAQIAELLGPQNADLAGAFSSGDKTLGSLAGGIMESRTPKQTAPHFWESNDGSLGMVGPDGVPRILYQDPTPKITTLALDNGDGTKTLVRVGPDGMPIGSNFQGGGGQTSSGGAVPTAPVGRLTPITQGGPSQPAMGNFRGY